MTTQTTTQGNAAPGGGTVNFNPNTGAKLAAGQTVNINAGNSTIGANPIVSSTGVRADNNALGDSITSLRSAYDQDAALTLQQRTALAQRRDAELSGINTEFDIAQKAQEAGQNSDYASRATSLVTSGGGFLGATQSQSGVLQNLKNSFDAEKTALVTKKEAAIRAAQNAYDDKDFALAREMTTNAINLEKEINNRQTSFADQQLKIASENRAQTTFDMGITADKVKSYSILNDAQFSQLTPAQLSESDYGHYPGYTAAVHKLTQQEASSQIASLASKYPSAGITSQDSFDIAQEKIRNSKEYKLDIAKSEADLRNTNSLIQDRAKGGTGTEGDRKLQAISAVTSKIVPGATLPTGETILNPDGGYINPKAWNNMIAHAPEIGLTRAEFIQNFAHYLYLDPKENKPISSYGLTPKELKDLGYE